MSKTEETTERRASLGFEKELWAAADLLRGNMDRPKQNDSEKKALVSIFVGIYGAPTIDGTNTKVVEIVAHQQAYDETPEEIVTALPHLTLAQVEAALEYYADHQEEIDKDLDRRLTEADRLRETMGQPAFAERLRRPR